MDIDLIRPLLSSILQFGAFGALVTWIVLKVIPRMQAETADSRKVFTESLEKQQIVFREEMRLEREAHREEQAEIREAIDHLTASLEGRAVSRR